MTKEEREASLARRQRNIDSLLKSMREDLPPPNADEVTAGFFLDMLYDNAAGVERLRKEQEEEDAQEQE